MAPEWIYIFIGAVALSAFFFLFFALLWLRSLRKTVLISLNEMAAQQIFVAQRTREVLTDLQKQQETSSKQLRALTQEGLRLQRSLSIVTHKLEDSRPEPSCIRRTIH